MVVKKEKEPGQLFAVVWVPDGEINPLNLDEAWCLGGDIIERNFSIKGAAEVVQCLNICDARHGGQYLAVEQSAKSFLSMK